LRAISLKTTVNLAEVVVADIVAQKLNPFSHSGNVSVGLKLLLLGSAGFVGAELETAGTARAGNGLKLTAGSEKRCDIRAAGQFKSLSRTLERSEDARVAGTRN
jgi:hypothetical protein